MSGTGNVKKTPFKVSGDLSFELGARNLKKINNSKRKEILKERNSYIDLIQNLKSMNAGLIKIGSTKTDIDISYIENIIKIFDERLKRL